MHIYIYCRTGVRLYYLYYVVLCYTFNRLSPKAKFFFKIQLLKFNYSITCSWSMWLQCTHVRNSMIFLYIQFCLNAGSYDMSWHVPTKKECSSSHALQNVKMFRNNKTSITDLPSFEQTVSWVYFVNFISLFDTKRWNP